MTLKMKILNCPLFLQWEERNMKIEAEKIEGLFVPLTAQWIFDGFSEIFARIFF